MLNKNLSHRVFIIFFLLTLFTLINACFPRLEEDTLNSIVASKSDASNNAVSSVDDTNYDDIDSTSEFTLLQDLTLYQNSDFGFSMYFPVKWDLLDEEDQIGLTIMSMNEHYDKVTAIVRNIPDGATNIIDYKNTYIEFLEENSEVSTFDTDEVITINDIDFLKFTALHQSEDETTYQVQYLAFHNSYAYEISLDIEYSNYEENISLFHEIEKSILIENINY